MDASFSEFMSQREAASRAFVNGDIGPLLALSTSTQDATIFGPKGDCVQGAQRVNAANQAGAQMFEPGSTSRFEVMHAASNDDLGYWTGIQRSQVHMKHQREETPLDLRVTEVFRKENGEWKLVHRHADPLAEAKSK